MVRFNKTLIVALFVILAAGGCSPTTPAVDDHEPPPVVALAFGQPQKQANALYGEPSEEVIAVYNCENPLDRRDRLSEYKVIEGKVVLHLLSEAQEDPSVRNAAENEILAAYQEAVNEQLAGGRELELPVQANSSAEYVIEWRPIIWRGTLPYENQLGAGKIQYEYQRIARGEIRTFRDLTERDCVTEAVLPTVGATTTAVDSFSSARPDLTGTLLLVSDREGNNEIYVYDLEQNSLTRLTENPADDWSPHWSPDGTRIVFSSDRDGSQQLYVMDANGTNVRRLTQNFGFACCSDWSSDGQRVVFNSNRGKTTQDLYAISADGTNVVQLTDNDYEEWTPKLSPDNSQLAFFANTSGNADIFVINLDDSGLLQLTDNDYTDANPTWSPDGMRLAFHSDRDGNFEIYTMYADGSNLMNVTNRPTRDRWPVWSPDGRYLAFTSTVNDREGVYVIDTSGKIVTVLEENASNNTVSGWRP